MRDWRASSGPGSFRGVVFYVESADGTQGGRHVATLEYIKRDTWDIEDMGAKAEKASVTGYVVGDDADAQVQALVAACNQRGAGDLFLPNFGSRQAICTNITPSIEKDRLGRFSVKMEFAFAGENLGVVSVPIYWRMALDVLQSLPSFLAASQAIIGAQTRSPDMSRLSASLVGETTTGLLASVKTSAIPAIPDAVARSKAYAQVEKLKLSGATSSMPVAVSNAASVLSVFLDVAQVATPFDMVVVSRDILASIALPRLSASPSIQAAQAGQEGFKALYTATVQTALSLASVRSGGAPFNVLDETFQTIRSFFPSDIGETLQSAINLIAQDYIEGTRNAGSLSLFSAYRRYPASTIAWLINDNIDQGSEIMAMNNTGLSLIMPPEVIVRASTNT